MKKGHLTSFIQLQKQCKCSHVTNICPIVASVAHCGWLIKQLTTPQAVLANAASRSNSCLRCRCPCVLAF